jgi:hypothetical protein
VRGWRPWPSSRGVALLSQGRGVLLGRSNMPWLGSAERLDAQSSPEVMRRDAPHRVVPLIDD